MFNRNGIGQYKHKLHNTGWQNVRNKQNTNTMYNFFLKKFLCLYNERFATKEHKIKQKSHFMYNKRHY